MLLLLQDVIGALQEALEDPQTDNDIVTAVEGVRLCVCVCVSVSVCACVRVCVAVFFFFLCLSLLLQKVCSFRFPACLCPPSSSPFLVLALLPHLLLHTHTHTLSVYLFFLTPLVTDLQQDWSTQEHLQGPHSRLDAGRSVLACQAAPAHLRVRRHRRLLLHVRTADYEERGECRAESGRNRKGRKCVCEKKKKRGCVHVSL